MKYRRLGKTELKVSVVGVGTFPFSGEWGKQFSQRQVNRLLSHARAMGINLLDTAECYGDHLAEALVGAAIRTTRDDWIIATKFGHQFSGFLKREDRWSARDVVRQLEASLTALQTDYVDIYQFHSGADDVFQQDDLWTMLDRQVQAGKVRHLGISLGFPYSRFQLQAALPLNVSVIQVRYNRLDRVAEEEVLPFCQMHDLGVLARVPLASGFLTGKYRAEDSFRSGDLRATFPANEVRERLLLVEELRATEVPTEMTMTQWALTWCLKHPAVMCVIPGCKELRQVTDNAAATRLLDIGHPRDCVV